MPSGFDPRIVGPGELSFLQACQRAVPFHLGGGAALAGVHLRHRLSADADLFVHSREAHRDLVRALPDIGLVNGTPVSVLRDAGSFVRALLQLSNHSIALDVVFDPVPDQDVPLALRKDAGVDPGVIAWLLGQFPVDPLPIMLVPLDSMELLVFRDDLRERFRRLAVP